MRVSQLTGLDHWTGLLDWNTGLEYWTETFFKNGCLTVHVHAVFIKPPFIQAVISPDNLNGTYS